MNSKRLKFIQAEPSSDAKTEVVDTAKQMEDLCEKYKKWGYDEGYRRGLEDGAKMSMDISDQLFKPKKAGLNIIVE